MLKWHARKLDPISNKLKTRWSPQRHTRGTKLGLTVSHYICRTLLSIHSLRRVGDSYTVAAANPSVQRRP